MGDFNGILFLSQQEIATTETVHTPMGDISPGTYSGGWPRDELITLFNSGDCKEWVDFRGESTPVPHRNSGVVRLRCCGAQPGIVSGAERPSGSMWVWKVSPGRAAVYREGAVRAVDDAWARANGTSPLGRDPAGGGGVDAASPDTVAVSTPYESSIPGAKEASLYRSPIEKEWDDYVGTWEARRYAGSLGGLEQGRFWDATYSAVSSGTGELHGGIAASYLSAPTEMHRLGKVGAEALENTRAALRSAINHKRSSINDDSLRGSALVSEALDWRLLSNLSVKGNHPLVPDSMAHHMGCCLTSDIDGYAPLVGGVLYWRSKIDAILGDRGTATHFAEALKVGYIDGVRGALTDRPVLHTTSISELSIHQALSSLCFLEAMSDHPLHGATTRTSLLVSNRELIEQLKTKLQCRYDELYPTDGMSYPSDVPVANPFAASSSVPDTAANTADIPDFTETREDTEEEDTQMTTTTNPTLAADLAAEVAATRKHITDLEAQLAAAQGPSAIAKSAATTMGGAIAEGVAIATIGEGTRLASEQIVGMFGGVVPAALQGETGQAILSLAPPALVILLVDLAPSLGLNIPDKQAGLLRSAALLALKHAGVEGTKVSMDWLMEKAMPILAIYMMGAEQAQGGGIPLGVGADFEAQMEKARAEVESVGSLARAAGVVPEVNG